MSAYLSSADCISALATYWEESLIRRRYSSPADEIGRAIGCASMAQGKGFPFDSYEKGRKLVGLASNQPASVVFELLLAENVASLKARYPDSPDMWQAAKAYRYKPSAYVRSLFNRGLGHGTIVGMLRGFKYQACEHDAWPTSIGYQLCEQISAQLLEHLRSRDDAETWASWEEPTTTEPQPIRLSALI